jgi:hypothetical protein
MKNIIELLTMKNIIELLTMENIIELMTMKIKVFFKRLFNTDKKVNSM